MGYKPQKRVFRLKFADEQYEGLEVMAKSVSTGTLLEFQALAAEARQETPGLTSSSSREEIARALAANQDISGGIEKFSMLVDKFAGVLISWNVEEEVELSDGTKVDQPVPPTRDGLLAQDPDFVMAIIMAWTDAVSGVNDPLPDASPSGEIFQELSLPMEVA
jgi:hypothetical protein